MKDEPDLSGLQDGCGWFDEIICSRLHSRTCDSTVLRFRTRLIRLDFIFLRHQFIYVPVDVLTHRAPTASLENEL